MATYTLNGQTFNTAGPVPVGGTMVNAQGQPAFGPQNTPAAPLDPNAPSGHSATYLQANPQFNQTASQLQANATNLTPGTTPTNNSTSTSNPYLDQVMALQQLSPGEVDAQTQLNTLQSNATQGQFNVSQQPVAQTFVSGQQAAMQTQANIAQQPLQLKLALAQAQRQAALDSAKTALEYQKPVSMGYGAQLVNPLTGATVNGGILGSGNTIGTGTINPVTGLTLASTSADILGYLASNGIDASRYDMPGLLSAVRSGATAQDIISGRAGAAGVKAAATSGSTYKMDTFGNYIQPNPVSSGSSSTGGFSTVQAVKDFQTAHGLVADGIVGPKTKAAMANAGTSGSSSMNFPKADNASLVQQQQYADTTQRAFNTANQNLTSLLSYMAQAGVNSGSTIPLINTIQNKVKGGVLDAGTIAGFQSALAGLRAEYSQVLSRGGQRSVETDNAAHSLIPDNLTPAQLKQVADRLNVEGTNAIKEANTQIQIIKDRASGKTNSTNSGTTIQTKVGAVNTDW